MFNNTIKKGDDKEFILSDKNKGLKSLKKKLCNDL